jgi:hypothetical protein
MDFRTGKRPILTPALSLKERVNGSMTHIIEKSFPLW